MQSLSLREHLPFLLCGLDQNQQHDFLTVLKPLAFDETNATASDIGPKFTSYQDFESQFQSSLSMSDYGSAIFTDRFSKVFANVRLFFDEVGEVHELGGDQFYDLKNGADVFVNCSESLGWDASDIFYAVQHCMQYDEALDVATVTEGIDEIYRLDIEVSDIDNTYFEKYSADQIVAIEYTADLVGTDACDGSRATMDQVQVEKLVTMLPKSATGNSLKECAMNLASIFISSGDSAARFLDVVLGLSHISYADGKKSCTLNLYEITAAVNWYYSKDLSWLKPADRLSIIKSSYDPIVVSAKEEKFVSYFNTPAYDEHRAIAENYLYGEMTWQVRDADKVGESFSEVRLTKWFGDTVDVEQLLTQVGIVILVESAGNPLAGGNSEYKGLMQVYEGYFAAGEDWRDPATNIGRGLNELFGHCMGDARNKECSITWAIAGFNAGAGNIIDYKKGQYTLTETTKNYIRDYIIYNRFIF